MVETNGKIVWSGEYDSFGNCQEIKPEIGGIDNPLRFPGQYVDEETGLYYNLNRYYDPKIGRYLQTDPAGDGLNPYLYAAANPVNAIDPNGLCALRMIGGGADIWAGGALIAGAITGPPGWVLTAGGVVVGSLMVLNGADNLIAGGRSALTGEYNQAFFESFIHQHVQNDLAADLLYMGTQVGLGYAGIRVHRAMARSATHQAWKEYIDTVIDDIENSGRPKTMVLGEGGQGRIRSFVNRDPRRMTEFLEMRPPSLNYSAQARAGTLTAAMEAETLNFNLMLVEYLHQRGFSFKVLRVARSADATSDWLRAELQVLERLGVSWDVIPQSHIDNVMKLKRWRVR